MRALRSWKQKIADTIPRPSIEVKLLIPYSHGEIISRLHEWDAEIKSTDFVSDGTFVVALVREDVASELSEYVLEGDLLEVLEEELGRHTPWLKRPHLFRAALYL